MKQIAQSVSCIFDRFNLMPFERWLYSALIIQLIVLVVLFLIG